MKKLMLLITWFFAMNFLSAQVPTSWTSTGIGGGGSLINPTINPNNTSEFYVACDMSEYFHSTDYGNSYSVIPFQNLQSGAEGVIRYTNNASILYGLSLANDGSVPVKSNDGGITWNKLPGNPDSTEYTFYMYANYYNTNQIIISYYDQMYITNNGGTSFTLIHTANNSGAGIVVGGAFFDGNNIYIGTNDGLFVSTNGGSSFSLDNSTGIPSGKQIYSFAAAKAGSTTRFFILVANKADVYGGLKGYDYWQVVQGVYSMDYGSGTWVQKQSGINISSDFVMEVGMAENDINTCYLAGSNTNGYPNVLKTTDGGSSWTHVFNAQNNISINTGWCGSGGDRDWGYAEVFFGMDVAKFDATKVIVSDFGFVHKTSDGASTWQQAYVNPSDQNPPNIQTPKGKNYHSVGLENTSSWQVFWIDQNNLMAGYSDIKAIRSNDAGSSWNMNYNSNLDQNTVYRIVKNPSNGYLYAGLSTIHDIYQSTHLTDATLDGSNSGKIIYSTDNGATWQLLHDFSHPVIWLALDPNNSNTMYASVINYGSGLGGIYKTTNLQNNSSSTWTKLPAPPRTEGHPFNVMVLNDGKVLCTYSGRMNTSGQFTQSSGVFIYDGSNWTDVSDPGEEYWSKDIVLDPNDASQNTWYVGVYKGWGSTQVNNLGGGLYKTTNRGSNWTRINSTDRVESITFDPNDANRIYMTTETQGLWTSDNVNDATPSFTLVSSYPFRQPERIFFNPYNTSEVWVTSFGNGIRIGSGCALPSVSISANGATTFCKGSSVTLIASSSGATSYQWTKNNKSINGATNTTYVANATGTYRAIASNSCGSTTSNSLSVTVNPLPAATISPSGTVNICAGQTVTLTANSGANLAYQWLKGSKNISGATNISYVASTAGKYKVQVTNTSTTCSKTSAATTINITCKDADETAPAFTVFPNPSAGDFNLNFPDDNYYDVKVNNVLGRTVLSFSAVSSSLRFGNELIAGIYFVRIMQKDELISTLKIIKTK